MPALAGVAMYRAMARQTGSPRAAVVAAAAYVLSATMLWGFSEGRLSFLVVLAVLPLAWDRIDAAFARRAPERPFRFGVGLGVALSIGAAFAPAIVLPVGLFALANLVAGRRAVVDRRWSRSPHSRRRCSRSPSSSPRPAMPPRRSPPRSGRRTRGRSSGSLRDGTRDLGRRGVPPWSPRSSASRAREIRSAAGRGERCWSRVAGTILAWASVAGHLPAALTNAPAWIAAAAVAESALVAYGLSTFGKGLERQAFGARQLGVAVLAVLLSVGIAAQALQVTFAEWAVRPGGLPPAWPVIASSSPGEFRILWVGDPDGERFPAPAATRSRWPRPARGPCVSVSPTVTA